MGQARKRGTFEERLAKALARNQALEAKITQSPILSKAQRKYGTQRLATRLIMAGLLVTAASVPIPMRR